MTKEWQKISIFATKKNDFGLSVYGMGSCTLHFFFP